MEGGEINNGIPKPSVPENIQNHNNSVLPKEADSNKSPVADSIADLSEKDPGARQALRVIDELNEIKELNAIKKQLPLAEEIARLRDEATNALIQAPSDQWENVYRQIVEKYPDLKDYREIFDAVFLSTKSSHDALNNTWKTYQPEKGTEDTLMQVMDVASPEASNRMFEDILGLELNGQARAEKGATTLRFTIDDEDYRKLRGYRDGEEITSGALTYHLPDFLSFLY